MSKIFDEIFYKMIRQKFEEIEKLFTKKILEEVYKTNKNLKQIKKTYEK